MPQALLSLAELGMQGGDRQQSQDDLKKIFANPKVDIDTKVKILYPYLQYWDVKKDNKEAAFELAEILTKTHPAKPRHGPLRPISIFWITRTDKALEILSEIA